MYALRMNAGGCTEISRFLDEPSADDISAACEDWANGEWGGGERRLAVFFIPVEWTLVREINSGCTEVKIDLTGM